MTNRFDSRSGNARGLGRLAVEATLGLTELVEAMHRTISVAPGPVGTPPVGRTRGLTGFVYGNVRGVTRLVGSSVDAALSALAPLLGEAAPSPGRDALVAALNGVLGDHLEASGNPFAIPMQLRKDGRALDPAEGALASVGPGPGGRILLLVHGLCMDESAFARAETPLGASLASDLGLSPVALRYNTGRHVSTNGRELSALLEAFLAGGSAPPPELTIVAHSMGGLVTRSALRAAATAGHGWPRSLRSVVFLGTPHHGAPTERVGNLVQAALGVSPYSVPFARLGKLRSAGITDLRYGNLVDEDWEGHDRFAHQGDVRRPLPLPPGIAFFAVAATTTAEAPAPGERLASDGLVPVESALGHHRDPERTLRFAEGRTWIARGTNHFDLLDRAEVRARLGEWLEPGARGPGSGQEPCTPPRSPA